MTWRWPRSLVWTRHGTLSRPGAEPQPLAADVWASAPGAPDPAETPVAALLSEVEASACAVYARYGLPDRPGQYARSPKADGWRFLSEDLTAEERWAFVTAQRPGSGWRFGALEDLGEQKDMPAQVRQAAGVLRACRRLRNRLAEGGSLSLGEELETAIRLGAQWRGMEAPEAAAPSIFAPSPPDVLPDPPTGPAEPLRLTMPARPRPKRKSRPKSRAPAGKA